MLESKNNLMACPLGNVDKDCIKNCKTKYVITRSKKRSLLYYCKKCDFEFFDYAPDKNLKNNKLDFTRLHKAGLSVPNFNEEFSNGLVQAKEYISKYLSKSDKNENILEIGCGLGYFLFLIKKKGSIPYGIEINNKKKEYVNKHLKIKCFSNIEDCKNKKFKKIFMFYSFEYIKNPYLYLDKLKKFLKKNGSIIIITPNKYDVLKNILENRSYNNFFYEENSINYFSKKSLIVLLKNLSFGNSKIFINQGYSIVNFFNWFINNSPKKTGLVGADKYIDDLIKILNHSNTLTHYNDKSIKIKIISSKLLQIIKKFNFDYIKLLNDYGIGNQIICIIK